MSYNEAFFKGGAIPAAVLLLEYEPTDEQRKQWRASWDAYTAQQAKRRRPLVLGGGVKDMQFPGQSPDDVTTATLPRLLRETICAVLGVPPAVVGIYEYANYANAQEQTRTFWQGRVLPLAQRIASGATEQLAVQYGADVRITLDTAGVAALQPDYIELAGAAQILVTSGVMDRDEVREALFNLPPKGGDWGTAYWGSITQVPLATEEGAAADTASGEVPEKALADGQKTLKVLRAEPQSKKTARHLDEQARIALYKAFNSRRDRREQLVVREIAAWYTDLQAEVLANLTEAAKAIWPANMRAPTGDALLFDETEAAKSLAARTTPVLAKIFQDAGEEALALAELGSDFALATSHIEELLRNRKLVMKTVTATAQTRVRRSLAEGIGEGETVPQLRERVLEWARAGKEQHAVTVARTEVGIVMNRAALDGYEQGGATGKEWLSIVDGRTRDSHIMMDGITVAIASQFSVNGIPCDGPGDPVLPIEEIANCRCTTAPVFEE